MRHIPENNTHDQAVLSFRAALSEALAPSPDYDSSEWLYVPNHYCDYRYILGTRGERPIICAGINPSTAAPGRLDRTLQSVERIGRTNGYDSFMMFNIYPQRATVPDHMESEGNLYLHEQNMEAFQYLLQQSHEPAVWAAWGTIIEKRPYLIRALRDFIKLGAQYGARWYHTGPLSKKGHPHHPLYLRSDTALEAFDIDTYLRAL